ncbi:hypothetical protein PN462_08035 [Spirulina sp. CS-785/01]|uniref:sulfotransferase family protein n=1 Tax=Spirulina sp. CS-785/01 TaxID=3021716 RepID=UPI00232E4A41|nr:hypothetical protein [Spirulina sp. CS-785/01]MDB9313048.1 hypothetical protein [Spirulina sp. CS-785/01]
MHRSGTSLTASLLQNSGVNLGTNFLEIKHGNVKGHFENIDFYEFHRNVLFSIGLSPDGWTTENKIIVPEQFVADAKALIEKYNVPPIWGWKDPRTTLFLDFWESLIPDAKFLFIYRSPWEVVDSLYRRGDITFIKNPNFAIHTWYNYNRIILNFFRKNSKKSLLLKLDKIIQNPNNLISKINQHFNLQLELKENVYESSLLNRSVKNTHRPTLVKLYFPEVFDLYCTLEKEIGENIEVLTKNESSSLVETGDISLYKKWVLQDWSDKRRIEYAYKNSQTQLQETQAQLQETQAQLHSELLQCQAIIRGMESSKFWQLRELWFFLKKKLSFFSVFFQGNQKNKT